MAVCESNATTASTRTPILELLSLLAGLGLAGCASGTVVNVNPDTSASDAGEKKDGGSPNDQNSKNDGPAADALYGACDPFTNSGCASGEKCTALQQSSGKLALGCDSKGSKGEGQDCSQTVTGGSQTSDDCNSGLACFSTTGAQATCHRICPTSGSANACPTGELCSLAVDGLDSLAFCQPVTPCQPLEQSGCGSEEGCYFLASGGYTGPLCLKKGSKKPGIACALANECEPGSNCLMLGSSGTCSSFCSTTDGDTPSCTGSATGGTICDPLGGSSSEPNLGICRVQP
jgi:hypothetical protein